MPSRNGKNASETIIEPVARLPALWAAILTASTLLVCPGPTPTVAQPAVVLATRIIALDFTSASTAEPKRARASSPVSTCFCVTHSTEFQSIPGGPCTWANQPPSSWRTLTSSARGPIGSRVSNLRFFLVDRISSAPGS